MVEVTVSDFWGEVKVLQPPPWFLRLLTLIEASHHCHEDTQAAQRNSPCRKELRPPTPNSTNWLVMWGGTLEGDPPAPANPSNDSSTSQHLSVNTWKTLSQILPQEPREIVSKYYYNESESCRMICYAAIITNAGDLAMTLTNPERGDIYSKHCPVHHYPVHQFPRKYDPRSLWEILHVSCYSCEFNR